MSLDFNRASKGVECSSFRDRRLRKLEKLAETFEFWIRTGSPVAAQTIRNTLVNHLGFQHHVPHGGGSHSRLLHPSGQFVTLIASNKPVLEYQVAAARAGLAVIAMERAALSLPKTPQPSGPSSQKPPPAPPLQARISGDYDLLPITDFEKTWVLRSRDYPQAGAVLYDGASDTEIERAKTAIDQTAEEIRSVLSQATVLEFDILKEEENLLLTHRVHEELDCVLPAFDPFAEDGNNDTRESLKIFIDAIHQMDEANEAALANIIRAFGLQEDKRAPVPDGSLVVHCTYRQMMSMDVCKARYTYSPCGRINPVSLLDLVDSLYRDVFETLKKDAKRFYGLETAKSDTGIVRIRHPYLKSINAEIPDLRGESLKAVYKNATQAVGLVIEADDLPSILEKKIYGLATLLEIRNKTADLLDGVSQEYNALIAHAAHLGHIRMRGVSSRKPGEAGFLDLSSSMENDPKCRMDYIVRSQTCLEKEVFEMRAPLVPVIPKPEGLIDLYHFLVECGSGQCSLPPFPARSAAIAAENKSRAPLHEDSPGIILVPVYSCFQANGNPVMASGYQSPVVSSPA